MSKHSIPECESILLANGDMVSLKDAVNCFAVIKGAKKNRSAEFATMVALVKGESISEHVAGEELHRAGIIGPDGALLPIYRSVLESALMHDAEGIGELSTPCDENPESLAAWLRENKRFTNRIVKSHRPFKQTVRDITPNR